MGMTLTNTSGDYAIERLKNMLVADRIGCDSAVFGNIKQDICNTVSKYFETSPEKIKVWVQYSKDPQENSPEGRDETIVCASIPVKKYNRTED